jgi:DNA polymerase-4
MWGVGPATRARLAEVGVLTIGQLAKTRGCSLKQVLGSAAGAKLAALAWNRDPREIKTHRRARSAGAQSALGRKPAEERVFRPTLLHLADRIGSRLRAKSRPGRTVTVRVRFANLNSVTRSVTLDAPISATVILAELAEELVRALLADHPHEKTISLLAISVSHLEEHWDVELELPLGLGDEARRPGTKRGMARWAADHAVDRIRDRFGWDAIGTDRRRWASLLLPFPTSFANSPGRDRRQYTVRPKMRASEQTRRRRRTVALSRHHVSPIFSAPVARPATLRDRGQRF